MAGFNFQDTSSVGEIGRFGGYDGSNPFAEAHMTSGDGGAAMFGTGSFQRHGFDQFGGGFSMETGGAGAGFLQSQSGADSRQQGTNEGAKSQRFMPFKISMINSAWLEGSAHFGVNVLDSKIDILRLVGVIRKSDYQEGSAMLSFVLDDGSGCISCDWALADDPSPWKQNLVKRLTEPYSLVKVYGGVSAFAKPLPHLNVHVARPLSHPDELQFHDIDVCYHLLRMAQNREANAPMQFGGNSFFDSGQSGSVGMGYGFSFA